MNTAANETITFYYHPQSRGRVAHWMLEEAGAKYEIKRLDLEKGEHKSPDYLKINPMGKVPTLVHRGTVITENAAICAYLADAFPQKKLAPALDDPERGAYYRWMFFAASCIEAAMLDKSHPRKGELTSSQLGHGNYHDVVATLEKAVGNGFLVKNQFTAADLYMCSYLEWYIFMKELEPKPVFTKYLLLCHDRPAYKRFTEQVGGFE